LQEESEWNNFDDFVANAYPELASEWKIRKFADKLKDMVCMLIGCTREQLEDQIFKNTVLPDVWDRYTVIYNNKTQFIGTKEEAEKVFNDYIFNLKINSGHIKIEKSHITPRLLLQQLGTDCCRNIINENIWVNALMVDYVGEYDLISDRTTYPNWIITDMRFPNEMEAVKERKGITIRVHRDLHNGNAHISPIPHESEIALDDAKFDYEIINDGTIEDLIEKVREILIKEKIL
jgi:hypothetical protein